MTVVGPLTRSFQNDDRRRGHSESGLRSAEQLPRYQLRRYQHRLLLDSCRHRLPRIGVPPIRPDARATRRQFCLHSLAPTPDRSGGQLAIGHRSPTFQWSPCSAPTSVRLPVSTSPNFGTSTGHGLSVHDPSTTFWVELPALSKSCTGRSSRMTAATTSSPRPRPEVHRDPAGTDLRHGDQRYLRRRSAGVLLGSRRRGGRLRPRGDPTGWWRDRLPNRSRRPRSHPPVFLEPARSSGRCAPSSRPRARTCWARTPRSRPIPGRSSSGESCNGRAHRLLTRWSLAGIRSMEPPRLRRGVRNGLDVRRNRVRSALDPEHHRCAAAHLGHVRRGWPAYWHVKAVDADGNQGAWSQAIPLTLPLHMHLSVSGSVAKGTTTTLKVYRAPPPARPSPASASRSRGSASRPRPSRPAPRGAASFKVKPTKKGTITFAASKTGCVAGSIKVTVLAVLRLVTSRPGPARSAGPGSRPARSEARSGSRSRRPRSRR